MDFGNGTLYVTGPYATANIFSTYPQPYLTTPIALVDQICNTAMLCIGVATIVDPRNQIPPWLQPTLIGLLLMSVGMALGMNAGYAVNPARDIGPRLLTLTVGYGWEVFREDEDACDGVFAVTLAFAAQSQQHQDQEC
ncbi:aquaporin-9 domain protein [Ancylostoma duodenale]|uniref:Aquaporin-9 domain protein n=1 Tax=Ancylostoma duodenale TaxID=51022 RepID=A0A0C2GEX5_9BILA|nr:aquaporin-9 domain protein [Ancylostoma duodenale]